MCGIFYYERHVFPRFDSRGEGSLHHRIVVKLGRRLRLHRSIQAGGRPFPLRFSCMLPKDEDSLSAKSDIKKGKNKSHVIQVKRKNISIYIYIYIYIYI